jgi:hypothetical protein
MAYHAARAARGEGLSPIQMRLIFEDLSMSRIGLGPVHYFLGNTAHSVASALGHPLSEDPA